MTRAKTLAMRTTLVLAALLALAACKKESAPETTTTPSAPAGPALDSKGRHVVELAVTEKGFEPSPVKVKAGEPLLLKVTRKTEKTCGTEIVIDELGDKSKTDLPLGQTVEIDFTPTKAGELKYGCAMDKMVAGVLLVE